MLKKIGGVVALAGLCALSLFLVNCGTSSNRPSGVLYVLTQGPNGDGNDISSFAIDLDTGGIELINYNATACNIAASESNPEPCGIPLNILLDPTGATAFVLNQGAPCLPGQCGNGNANSPTIFPYTVNSDGSLSAPGTPVFWSCTGPLGSSCSQSNAYQDTATAMARDAAGQFLFVINEGHYPWPTTCPLVGRGAESATDAAGLVGCPSVSVFQATPGSTTLTFVSQSATYQSPFFLSKTPSGLSSVTFTPPGGAAAQELLFVTDNYDLCTIACSPPASPSDNTVSVYSVSSSGVLTEQANSPYTIAAANPISVIAVNTNQGGSNGGVFVYVGNQDSTGGHLYPFQVCTVQNSVCTTAQEVQDNLLTPLGTCPQISCQTPPSAAGSNPVAMVVDPTNSFLYVASQGSNQVFGYRINTTPGTLTAQTPAYLPTGQGPISLALHPTVNTTGQYLFVSNSESDNITGITLSTITGGMSNPTTVITPAPPSGLAVH